MTNPPPPAAAEPLHAGEGAYDHFARDIGDPVASGRLYSALLRLLPDGPDFGPARAAVLAAQAAGHLMLTDDLPEDDTAFLAAWPAPGALPPTLDGHVEIALPGPRLHLSPHMPAASHNGKPGSDPAPIVCVIDDGIGFLNARFRRAVPGGTATRFHAVWLQSYAIIAPPAPSGRARLGRVLTRGDIDAMLAQGPRLEEEAEYRRLNAALFPPSTHRATDRWMGHGTAVLDLAAGADPGAGQPEETWPLLAVQLAPEAVDDTSGTRLAPMIVQGVRWCLRMARQISSTAPVVINISFATFAGPKNGTSALERMVARLTDRWEDKWGRPARVVLSFGNARRTRQAARLAVGAVAQTLDWRLPPDDFTPSFVELRADPGQDIGALSLTVTPPRGPAQVLTPLPPGTHVIVADAAGRRIGRLYHVPARATGGGLVNRAHLVLAMCQTAEDGPRSTAPHGAVALSLSSALPLSLRAEVQRDDTIPGYRLNGRQSWLDHPLVEEWDDETMDYGAPGTGCPITRAGTHSAFASAASPRVLAVAATRADSGAPTRYSAEGAAWVMPGPSLAAPGDRSLVRPGVLAAAMHSGSTMAIDGTSAAAGLTTRALARHLAGTPAPVPGPAEVAALIATGGTPAAPGTAHRVGQGVLALAPLVPAHHL